MSYHGRFFPKRPDKYSGDLSKIVFRSAWERTFMEHCETHDDVLQWSSEELSIPYYLPGDGRWHRYYPDFVLQVKEITGAIRVWMVEIKPSKQLSPPKIKPHMKANKRLLREVHEYAKNQAKWPAAKAFCDTKQWKFVVLTEKELYPHRKLT